MSDFDPSKLAALQARAAASKSAGAKAPIRRKVAPKAAGAGDDKKLQTALKKLNVQPLNGVEEVNVFKQDGTVLHFNHPRVHAAAGANTYAIYGQGQNRELTDLMPSILNQLGPDAMASLRKIAEQYQSQQVGAAGASEEGAAIEGADEEDVPELVDAAPDAAESKGNLEDVFDTTSLNSLPSRLIDWLPRVRWHTRRDKRRLSTLWDVGALVALIGGVIAQGVLLLAAYRAVGALWSIITSTEAAPALSAGLVKRAPVDVVPPPSSEVSPAQDLLLRPLIPSFSSLPLVVFALVISQGFHELGHALAAASDSLPLLSVGFHLYFPLLLPTFYVALPSASSSLSFEAGTSPLTDLRLATAGVWHNLLLVGGAWAMAESGLGVGGALAEAVGAVERVEEGVVVDEVDKTSPLYQHLPRGTLITHLDDLELDASTSFSGSTLDLWKDYLRPDSPRAKAPYSDMGWCLSANLFTETAACCSTLTANDTASSSDAVKPELCFESTSNSTTPTQQSCLDPLTLLSPSSPLPPRCIDASSCASHSGTVCARISPREQVLRLGVRIAGAARMVVGERATVLWQGRREGVLQHVHVTSVVPRWRILPLGLDLTFERIYQSVAFPPSLHTSTHQRG
ncbi:hypothetical protein JCM11641_007614 [Rhodosporidiobolus odoratus]